MSARISLSPSSPMNRKLREERKSFRNEGWAKRKRLPPHATFPFSSLFFPVGLTGLNYIVTTLKKKPKHNKQAKTAEWRLGNEHTLGIPLQGGKSRTTKQNQAKKEKEKRERSKRFTRVLFCVSSRMGKLVWFSERCSLANSTVASWHARVTD